MARRTFFSFHYQEDVWRAWNVRNCWVVNGDQESVGFFDGSVFEASKKEGDDALKTFLRNGLKKTAICILRLEISFSAKAMKRLSWLEAKV